MLFEKIEEFKMKLQLFADKRENLDEDLDEDLEGFEEDPLEDNPIVHEDLEEEEELEESEDEDTEEETETEEEEEDIDTEDPKEQDKVTKALIKAKKEKKELERRLKEFEENQKQEELKQQKEKDVTKYLDQGFSQEEAEEKANTNFELQQTKRELMSLRFEMLEGKYPGIKSYMDEIITLSNKTGMSFEEVYRAKYYSLSEYEIKTKAEQNALHKKAKAKAKSTATGTQRTKETVALTKDEETAYRHLIKDKNFSHMTRSDYKKLVSMDDLGSFDE